jgi:hypothetical protein
MVEFILIAIIAKFSISQKLIVSYFFAFFTGACSTMRACNA